ncbi:unnamed protein product [Amoebophrya sp. A25]|nr:unnamed protein product [Amoebophrya sp. A25]|eukprot:GSA25T00007306001.1
MKVDGSLAMSGFTHHCCSPCKCDMATYVRVDTATVKGETMNVLVIRDPCNAKKVPASTICATSREAEAAAYTERAAATTEASGVSLASVSSQTSSQDDDTSVPARASDEKGGPQKRSLVKQWRKSELPSATTRRRVSTGSGDLTCSEIFTSLQGEAPAIRCDTANNNKLKGAKFSDSGHPIIGVLFPTQMRGTPAGGQYTAAQWDQEAGCEERTSSANGQCAATGMGTIFIQAACLGFSGVTDTQGWSKPEECNSQFLCQQGVQFTSSLVETGSRTSTRGRTSGLGTSSSHTMASFAHTGRKHDVFRSTPARAGALLRGRSTGDDRSFIEIASSFLENVKHKIVDSSSSSFSSGTTGTEMPMNMNGVKEEQQSAASSGGGSSSKATSANSGQHDPTATATPDGGWEFIRRRMAGLDTYSYIRRQLGFGGSATTTTTTLLIELPTGCGPRDKRCFNLFKATTEHAVKQRIVELSIGAGGNHGSSDTARFNIDDYNTFDILPLGKEVQKYFHSQAAFSSSSLAPGEHQKISGPLSDHDGTTSSPSLEASFPSAYILLAMLLITAVAVRRVWSSGARMLSKNNRGRGAITSQSNIEEDAMQTTTTSNQTNTTRVSCDSSIDSGSSVGSEGQGRRSFRTLIGARP